MYINDDPGVTETYFVTMSNLGAYTFKLNSNVNKKMAPGVSAPAVVLNTSI